MFRGWFGVDAISLLPLQSVFANLYALKLFRLLRLPKLIAYLDVAQFHQVPVSHTADLACLLSGPHTR